MERPWDWSITSGRSVWCCRGDSNSGRKFGDDEKILSRRMERGWSRWSCWKERMKSKFRIRDILSQSFPIPFKLSTRPWGHTSCVRVRLQSPGGSIRPIGIRLTGRVSMMEYLSPHNYSHTFPPHLTLSRSLPFLLQGVQLVHLVPSWSCPSRLPHPVHTSTHNPLYTVPFK